MPNRSLEKFMKKIPGRFDEPRDMDAIIDSSGDFRTLVGIDAILKGLYVLLMISEGTYLFDPEIGAGIYRFIFELADNTTKSGIERALQEIVTHYETRAKITYAVKFFNNKKGFRVDLFVDYEGQKKSLSIDFDETLLKTLS